MATQALDYSKDGGWSWRKFPWGRTLCAVIALYFGVYGALRATGQITHRWGVLPGKTNSFVGHDWEVKLERGQNLFLPAVALEMAIRDLGPSTSR